MPCCSIMSVFDCIVAITTSNVVPRVTHRQSVEGQKCLNSGSSFKGGLNLTIKSWGLFVPIASRLTEEI